MAGLQTGPRCRMHKYGLQTGRRRLRAPGARGGGNRAGKSPSGPSGKMCLRRQHGSGRWMRSFSFPFEEQREGYKGRKELEPSGNRAEAGKLGCLGRGWARQQPRGVRSILELKSGGSFPCVTEVPRSVCTGRWWEDPEVARGKALTRPHRTTETDCLTRLEARGPRSKHHQAHTL